MVLKGYVSAREPLDPASFAPRASGVEDSTMQLLIPPPLQQCNGGFAKPSQEGVRRGSQEGSRESRWRSRSKQSWLEADWDFIF